MTTTADSRAQANFNDDSTVIPRGVTSNVAMRAQHYNYDFANANQGGAIGNIRLRGPALPPNCVILSVHALVRTIFAGGAGATIQFLLQNQDTLALGAALSTAQTIANAQHNVAQPVCVHMSSVGTAAGAPVIAVGTLGNVAGGANIGLAMAVAVAALTAGRGVYIVQFMVLPV